MTYMYVVYTAIKNEKKKPTPQNNNNNNNKKQTNKQTNWKLKPAVTTG